MIFTGIPYACKHDQVLRLHFAVSNTFSDEQFLHKYLYI